MYRINTCPILEVDAALRKHLLHRLNELVHKGKEIGGRRRSHR
jgi:hypothetical protein